MKNQFLKNALCLTMILVLLFSVTIAVADEGTGITPRYTYTDSISASLSFSGTTAVCSGSVSPSGNYNCSISVTLYRQEGTSWIYVASWYGSSSGGSTANAGGSKIVGSGTFKVTTRANIGNGLETPTTSVIRSN